MNRFIILFLWMTVSFVALGESQTVHNFKALDIDGKTVDMKKYQGKVLLIVNVASQCGLTPQYKQLQELYKKYSSQGLEVIAFPANNFNKQEPGSNEEIKKFCSTKFGVTFQLMSKIDVKGPTAHKIYKHLITETGGAPIKWNFEKFLVGSDGKVIQRFSPRMKPNDKAIVNEIEMALKTKK